MIESFDCTAFQLDNVVYNVSWRCLLSPKCRTLWKM